MADTPTTAQLDLLTRVVLSMRESCEAALLQLAAMRGTPAAPPLVPVAPAVPPRSTGRRPVRVMNRDEPYGGETPLGAAAVRDLVGMADTAPPAVLTADEAGPSDAS